VGRFEKLELRTGIAILISKLPIEVAIDAELPGGTLRVDGIQSRSTNNVLIGLAASRWAMTHVIFAGVWGLHDAPTSTDGF
jgi:hypothetical protein